MNNGITVLSLFDGMSMARQAVERLGVKVNKYYASEVDKYAMKVAQQGYPDTIQIGDITKLGSLKPLFRNGDMLIDLVIGGSPCQGFSVAGKKANFDDPRSKLFWEYVRVLKMVKEVNPDVKFILENVRMKQEWQDVISEALGVKPIMINSALVSAQNRVRSYWTNIEGIEQPEDKGIMLKDIIHEGEVDRDKALCLDSNYHKGGGASVYLNKSRRQIVYHEHAEYVVDYHTSKKMLDREVERGKVGKAGNIYYVHGKQVKLGVGQDADYIFGCITPNRVNKRQNGQRFSSGQKFYTLTAQDKHGILIQGYIRMLTPTECERLQGVRDGYTECEGVSKTQQYKMLGNGFNVDTICHLLKGVFN